MEWSAPFTLTTPGPDISFNTGSGDEYILDPAECEGDAPSLRATVDDAPQTDGAIVHDAFAGAWYLTLVGTMNCTTGTAAARNTMEANLKSAVAALWRADGTLSQTPSGAGARSITVRAFTPVRFSGAWLKRFAFTLVSGNTDWS